MEAYMAPDLPSKALHQLSAAPLDVVQQQIASGELQGELSALLGPALAAELEQLAQAGAPEVLALEERPLVVLLPGITGSSLNNVLGDTGLIWLNPLALVAGKLGLLRLDATGRRDVTPGVQIVATGLLPTHYLLIQIHMRTLGGCDVLGFPFDWRRTPAAAVDDLRRLVLGQFRATGRKVHLVGHSMGGLVARDFCLRYAADAARAVTQIIQLGTPNYGSCETIRNLTLGGETAALTLRLNPANAPLQMIRTCPGLYTMLPAPPDLYPSDAPFAYPYSGNLHIYDAAAYQTDGVSARHIAAAQESYAWLAGAGALPVPCTIIAGYDLPTCVGVSVTNSQGGPSFDFSSASGPDGDGTVPLASATALPGANRFYGSGLKHGDLPLYGVVRSAVIDLVHSRQPSGLEQAPHAGVLGAVALEAEVPEHPTPGTLSEPELDLIAARIRAGAATPEDLQALAGGH
jgi:pimeloyl-ACP methyl ester carboxylesterase